VDISLLK